jgi:hypothetical protein
MIKYLLSPSRFSSSSHIIFHRPFSFSSPSRNLFKSLFNHFQYARKAKQAAQARGLDLSRLTAEQQMKLKPVLRLQSAFRVVNVVMGVMAVIAAVVWYSRRKKQFDLEKEINDQWKPLWMDLKYFKHKGAMVGNYLLPEQIVSKLNQIKPNNFNLNRTIVFVLLFLNQEQL